MKKVLIFVLSLISALTFSLSSCSSSSVFKKIEIYGYGYNKTFYEEEWNDYHAEFLAICCIFQDDYFISNEYGVQFIYEKDLENYKSVDEYISENKNIRENITPSNRQVSIYEIGYGFDNHLKYIALYDYIITKDTTARTINLVDIIEISPSDIIYKQYQQ